MNVSMHDLLTTAVDRRASGLAHGQTFADGHESKLMRAIRVRRLVTRAGAGAAVAAVVAGAVFGIHSWAGEPSALQPGGSVTVAPADSVVTEMVSLPWGNAEYDFPDQHVFYITLGATGMIPFPDGGLWYPGAPDVPSDAVLVIVHGDAGGYDLTASDAVESVPGVSLARAPEDYLPDEMMFEVLGEVTSTSRWGIHLYLVDGYLVTLEEGQSNARAVEVTAWTGPEDSD